LTAAGFTRLWNIPYDPLRSQSSPLVVDGHVYLMDDNFHFCFDLATGRELWKEKVGSSAISSPVLADGKIFLSIGGGSKIIMLKPSPEKRIQLGKANVRALWCPSPAIADGKLLLRGRKGISCYSLTAAQASLPGASR
jgi:outer membrane protein assembly factor BamB